MGIGKVKCDFSEFEDFRDRVQNLVERKEDILKDLTIDITMRLYRKVKKRTPVGDYTKLIQVTAKRNSKYHKKGEVYTKRVNPSGKRGGTLRRGWEVGSVKKNGGAYTVEIYNNVEYAPYVEYGHRTKNHRGWVRGRYMLTISEKEIGSKLDQIVRRKIEKILKEALNDK